MPSLRRNEGESLEAWDARMAAAWKEGAEKPQPLSAMSPAELRAAEAAIMTPSPYCPQPPADLAGRKIQDMDVRERQRCAEALGIAHLFSSFV